MSWLDFPPQVRLTNLWVSVTERLPALGTEVLVWRDGTRPSMCVARRIETRALGVQWIDCHYERYLNSVTYWMPLPNPPGGS